jgi:hypothetical protein
VAGFGKCRLTGKLGNFVKAHIIPEALTKPSIAGESFIQAGQGDRPVRRWTSWYDANLVTSDGERILADYDSWGIAELRRLNLVWSSLGNSKVVDREDWNATGNEGHGVRIFDYDNGDELRLFLLSILWRAAASKMTEFKYIRIPGRQLDQLGKMLLNRDPKPYFLFAACLIQLTSIGPRHNFTPMAGKKRSGPSKKDQTRIFRFYFDGLAVHFHRDAVVRQWRQMGDLCIQNGKQIGVVTVPFESSMQNEVMEREAERAEAEWPEAIFRLAK